MVVRILCLAIELILHKLSFGGDFIFILVNLRQLTFEITFRDSCELISHTMFCEIKQASS